jgi:hypothetical protein
MVTGIGMVLPMEKTKSGQDRKIDLKNVPQAIKNIK